MGEGTGTVVTGVVAVLVTGTVAGLAAPPVAVERLVEGVDEGLVVAVTDEGVVLFVDPPAVREWVPLLAPAPAPAPWGVRWRGAVVDVIAVCGDVTFGTVTAVEVLAALAS